jgi:hypothetical protein
MLISKYPCQLQYYIIYIMPIIRNDEIRSQDCSSTHSSPLSWTELNGISREREFEDIRRFHEHQTKVRRACLKRKNYLLNKKVISII